MSASVHRPRLFVNRVPERTDGHADLDCLIALEYGRVDDGQPDENWRVIADRFGYLHDGPGGRCLGFKVPEYSAFDPSDRVFEEIWGEPLFDAPLVGLTDASAGEIITALGPLLGAEPTVNRRYFSAAMRLSGKEALAAWFVCLQSGDSMAHFALGYTLFELGRFHEAYRHLRYYAEIAPAHPWNLCWYGKAAEAIGETAEAEQAYERAIALSDAGADETDAPELLAALRARGA